MLGVGIGEAVSPLGTCAGGMGDTSIVDSGGRRGIGSGTLTGCGSGTVGKFTCRRWVWSPYCFLTALKRDSVLDICLA